ncbi:MAG: hypothetical protein ACLSAF_16955 [Intestinimonas sp.]
MLLGETDALPLRAAAECRNRRRPRKAAVPYVVQARTEEDTDAVAKVGDKDIRRPRQTAIDAARGRHRSPLLKDTAGRYYRKRGTGPVCPGFGRQCPDQHSQGSRTVACRVLGGRLTSGGQRRKR